MINDTRVYTTSVTRMVQQFSALSVATLDKAEAKTAAWPAKTAAWRAACDASGVVSYADFGIRVGAVEEAARRMRISRRLFAGAARFVRARRAGVCALDLAPPFDDLPSLRRRPAVVF